MTSQEHEALSVGRSLQGLSKSVEGIVCSFDNMMSKLQKDKNNYFKQGLGMSNKKIVTKELVGIIKSISDTEIGTGNKFHLETSDISVVASAYTSQSQDAWTGANIKNKMISTFVPKKITLDDKISTEYSWISNTLTKKQLSKKSNAIFKTGEQIAVTKSIVSEDVLSPNYMISRNSFSNRFNILPRFGRMKNIKLSFEKDIAGIELSDATVGEINQNLTDAELNGSGSKISQFVTTQEPVAGTDDVTIINLIRLKEVNHSIRIDGTDYTYTYATDDTLDDIEAGLEDALAEVDGIDIVATMGYYSMLFKDDDGDKVFNWLVRDETEDVEYIVEMITPSDEHDLTIEASDTDSGGKKITITFEHDGSDVVYPLIADIVDLVNTFDEAPFEVIKMDGFKDDDEYPYNDTVTLEQFQSKMQISFTRDADVSFVSGDTWQVEVTDISNYNAATPQISECTIVKFNKEDTFSITLADTETAIDASQEAVSSESELASLFETKINDANLSMNSNTEGAKIVLTATTAGEQITLSNSGENNYTIPVERNTILRNDLKELPKLDSFELSFLKKQHGQIYHKKMPLNKYEAQQLTFDGILANPSNVFRPILSHPISSSENSVCSVGRFIRKASKIINASSENLIHSSEGINPVPRGSAVIETPFNSTQAGLADRWFFAEAGSNCLATKDSLREVLTTIAPVVYEKKILGTENNTFSEILSERLYKGNKIFGSLNALCTEDISVKKHADKKAFFSNYEKCWIEDSYGVSEETIENFVMDARVPQKKYSKKQYTFLFRLAASLDDDLREERFIALASAFVAPYYYLTEFFVQEDLAIELFGTDDPEDSPDNNYGIDGVPIDSHVTVKDLYFRNFRKMALPLTEKVYPFDASMLIDSYTALLFQGDFEISNIESNKSLYIQDRYLEEKVPLSLCQHKITKYQLQAKISDSSAEDYCYGEIVRKGYFADSLSLAINHSLSGYSKKHKDSLWSILMDAVEITDGGDIVSINSAKSMLQTLYHSYTTVLTKEELGTLLLLNTIMTQNNTNHKNALHTIFLKIFFYLKSKGDSIAYSDWKTNFDSITGLLFTDDEEKTDLLPYDWFLVWICLISGSKAFSYSTDIEDAFSNVFPTMSGTLFKEACFVQENDIFKKQEILSYFSASLNGSSKKMELDVHVRSDEDVIILIECSSSVDFGQDFPYKAFLGFTPDGLLLKDMNAVGFEDVSSTISDFDITKLTLVETSNPGNTFKATYSGDGSGEVQFKVKFIDIFGKTHTSQDYMTYHTA